MPKAAAKSKASPAPGATKEISKPSTRSATSSKQSQETITVPKIDTVPDTPKKRGRPAMTKSKLIHLLLTNYNVLEDENYFIMKVDRMNFYSGVRYEIKPEATERIKMYEFRPGDVVATWNYGNLPLLIKAITTNSTSNNSVFKVICSPVLSLEEELPTCPIGVGSGKTTADVSFNIADVWFLFDTHIKTDPSVYPLEKLKKLNDIVIR